MLVITYWRNAKKKKKKVTLITLNVFSFAFLLFLAACSEANYIVKITV